MEKIKLSKVKYKKLTTTMATIKSTIETALADIKEKEKDNLNLQQQKCEIDKMTDRQAQILSAEYESRIINNNTAIENNKILIETLQKKYDLLTETVEIEDEVNE